MMDEMKTVLVDGVQIHTDNQLRKRNGIHGTGQITRNMREIKPSKSMCAGCRDDFYNDHNPHGVKECWMFKQATVCNKVGYSSIHCANGPDTIMEKTLDCWHGVRK